MITGKQITQMIIDECAAFAAKCHDDMLDALKYGAFGRSWHKWSAVKDKKSSIWTLTHNATGYVVRSHNRAKAEKKMAQFHAIHVKLTR